MPSDAPANAVKHRRSGRRTTWLLKIGKGSGRRRRFLPSEYGFPELDVLVPVSRLVSSSQSMFREGDRRKTANLLHVALLQATNAVNHGTYHIAQAHSFPSLTTLLEST
jgi:hypothetical protein